MRSGLDYFPLDTTLDTKFELIEAEFGLTGFAVIVKLFQMIYGQEGYYGEVNDEVVLLFSKRCALGGSTVSEIISAAVRRGIFDKELYERYGILTSEGIQKRYFEACKRREKIEVCKEYLLGNCNNNFKNVYISEKNVNNSSKNGYIGKQSKESKVKKESKESKRHAYGEYKNVYLTDEDYQKWTSECALAEKYIEDMSSYLARTGKSYKNYLAALRKWYSEDKSKAPQTASYDLKEAERKSIERRPVYRGKQNG